MIDLLLSIKQTSEILGPQNIDCLTNLFKEMDGTPPCVNKKRYRAKYPDQIKNLDYLEHSAQLIVTKHDNTGAYYHLRSYAIPLINDAKAQNLLNLMCKIYEQLSLIYKDRLDENITKEDLLKELNFPEKETLEALSYFRESHDVWTGWGDGFPYRNGSHINISEKVILKESFLKVTVEYYRWHFINKNSIGLDHKAEISLSEIKVENKKTGRPSHSERMNSAYDLLKENNQIDFSKSLAWNIVLIRKAIFQLYPELNNDPKGLGESAISKNISPRFHADKVPDKR